MPRSGGRPVSPVTERSLDVICLGRAAVDLYGQQVGGRLEDMQTFAKYLGGSSGNLAAGLARLGAKSAMLTRVGDDHMGRFVREQLEREGVDTTGVLTDPERLTALVILGIGSAEDIPHIFYRERCADMGLVDADVDENYIATSRALAITGTHLSTESTCAAVRKAIDLARRHGTHVVLDIDYRPVLWGLGSGGDGASRYAESEHATAVLQSFVADCDLLIGTEEEIAIAGGTTDLLQAVQTLRAKSAATIVLKRGADGCTVFAEERVSSLDDGIQVGGFNVEVFNTVGAGDAFLSGFLSAWLDDLPWLECGRRGNACGALVVARHGCTPAMPGRVELEYFLSLDEKPRQPRLHGDLVHLHRVTTWQDDPRPLCVLAFDHRSQFEELAALNGKPFSAIAEFKNLITDVLLDECHNGSDSVRYGAIVDHRYGDAALARLTRESLWAASPVEVPGSRPLQFDPHFATGQTLLSWPSGQIVKCLLFYHPDDDAELRHAQEEQVRQLYADIVAMDRRFVFEIICPTIAGETYPEPLPRALRRFYNLGVKPDWWKLETQTPAGWQAVADIVNDCDPHCKGVVILGLGADEKTLHDGLSVAAGFDLCRGFAVGRSIFATAADDWFAGKIDDDKARASIQQRYRSMIDIWIRSSTMAA